MEAGPLPELQVGEAKAPVTIVEYASMTCGHCANFHNTIYPALKAKYIDTGKVRLIMREFPLDDRATGAAMLARCTGDGKTFPLISALFAKQEEWAFVSKENFVPELAKIARQAGFTEESLRTCLARPGSDGQDPRSAAGALPMSSASTRRRPSSSTASGWPADRSRTSTRRSSRS